MTKQKNEDILLLSNKLLNDKPRFTLFESRIFYSLLYRQDRSAEAFSEIRIPVIEFAEEWGIQGNNNIYRIIEETVGSMPRGLFSELSYDKNSKAIIGKFSEDIEKDILKQKKNFTKLRFSDITKLTSETRLRLYELMREYQNIGSRKFKADEMVSLLSEKETYKKNKSEFERRVLNPAVEQINKETSLFVGVEKQGRGANRYYTFFIKDRTDGNSEKAAKEVVKEEVKDPICEAVLNYLNERAKTNYKYSEENVKNIKKRIEDGYELEDFKVVIDNKLSDWENDEKMSKYIRPETLFGKKFEGYRNQKNAGLMAPDDPDYLSYMEYFARGADY